MYHHSLISQVEPTEIVQLTQGHAGNKKQSWDLNPGLLPMVSARGHQFHGLVGRGLWRGTQALEIACLGSESCPRNMRTVITELMAVRAQSRVLPFLHAQGLLAVYTGREVGE